MLGPNGAGKTTLLRVLAGALRPQAGAVMMAGQHLTSYGPAGLARRRAVLAHHSGAAMGMTVADVVALGRLVHRRTQESRHDLAAIEAICGTFALAPLWDGDTVALSGGERQRVHLARAAAQLWRPDQDTRGLALFLDDPAASLDLAQQAFALRFARSMAVRGATVLAVLHAPNHALDADQWL